jgi:hypothetical protein
MKHVPPPTGTPIAGPELTPEALSARLAKQAAQREKAQAERRPFRIDSPWRDRTDSGDGASVIRLKAPREGDNDRRRGFGGTTISRNTAATTKRSHDEPSLGWLDYHGNGTSYAERSHDGSLDWEGDEHDGREPEDDTEPSLGSFDRLVNQQHAWTANALQSYLDFEEDKGVM